MIFYGKAQRRVAVEAALRDIEGWIAEALTAARPIERHAAWVAAMVEAGALAQGLADREDDATVRQSPSPLAGEGASPKERRMRGTSPRSPLETDYNRAHRQPPSSALAPQGHLLPRGEKGNHPRPSSLAMALCLALATVAGRSWDAAFANLPTALPAAVDDALAALRNASGLPEAVEIRRTEGFAHYALYPEAFWQAASRLAAPRPTRVLGLRSIGTVLSAAVAAALGAPQPRTVRPHGHPFARRVTLAPLAAAEREAVWAVADEGPGLSGSSIGAAADALVEEGVATERIVLLPGHAGPPGPMASDAHRRLWTTARSAAISFEDLMGDKARGLAAWVSDLTGPLLEPPEDLAGGQWRRHHWAEEAAWPAVDRQNERRKYLLRGEKGTVLLRFAGLGTFGRLKLRRAEALAAAGFGLAPLGLRHGFLVEPWRGDLRPLAPAETDRPALLDRLSAYLAFRARAFPAEPAEGAPLDALLAMARANAAEALGDEAAARLDDWTGRLPGLARVARPIAIDGRLAPHEWLHDPAGPPLKTDALDHCCGHDLVGCQDIAWDVAGAAAEWDLSDAETEDLRASVERRGIACDPALAAFFCLAYRAFRVGVLALARGREQDDGEARRLETALALQVAALARALEREPARHSGQP